MTSPDAEYWASKLSAIRTAIRDTEATMAGITDARQIEAHAAQVDAYKRNYAVQWQRFLAWRKNRQ